ncbi:hypothetical protein H7F51_00310 [Novosphingobium flavum]|uniref:Uncharacterized protein n=1 Tax=Novosphingobium flavum TaxID=1778672 RepID=A0A7X1FPG8_9SPHN|nr:hypothetical protein [Novosphingobium flavum]MBC2663952.1 hypothetical protein [Novosphingobium flavum]
MSGVLSRETVDRLFGLGAPVVPFPFRAAAGAGIGARAKAVGRSGNMVGAFGREVGIVIPLPRLGFDRLRLGARQGGEEFVEALGAAARIGAGFALPVEPGEMGEEQARVEAAADGDLLAVIEHRFLHTFKRALGQDLLGMFAGEDQRGIPGGGEMGRAAAGKVSRLRRYADGSGGRADRAAQRQGLTEPRLPLGREAIVAQSGEMGLRFQPRPLIPSLREDVSRKPQIARGGDPAATERAGRRIVVIGHDPALLQVRRGSREIWDFGGCRKMVSARGSARATAPALPQAADQCFVNWPRMAPAGRSLVWMLT